MTSPQSIKQRGASAVEYAVLLSLVAFIVFPSVGMVGSATGGSLDLASLELTDAEDTVGARGGGNFQFGDDDNGTGTTTPGAGDESDPPECDATSNHPDCS
jgi:Flp pilus assembly pilin Flp